MTKSASESPRNELEPVHGSGKRENAPSAPYGSENPIPDFSPAPNLTEQRPFSVPELSEQGERWGQESREWEGVEQPQITVAQVRAALADVLDAGYQCGGGCDMRHPWTFPTERFLGDAEPTDFDIELRVKFIDAVLARFTELQVQEKSK